MPRPSMAAQRKAEILDAFEACILADSLESTSLETIAKEAGMKRSILRHYIGNRDDIIVALSERYEGYFEAQWQQTVAALPSTNRLQILIDILFDERDSEYIEQSIIADAIYGQAKRIEAVREGQLRSMRSSLNVIESELQRAYPLADTGKIALVASGILSNYLQSESLLPLSQREEIVKLKDACLLFITVLKAS